MPSPSHDQKTDDPKFPNPVVALFGALENENGLAMEHAAAGQRLTDAAAAVADAQAVVDALAVAKATVLKLSLWSKWAFRRGNMVDARAAFCHHIPPDTIENETNL